MAVKATTGQPRDYGTRLRSALDFLSSLSATEILRLRPMEQMEAVNLIESLEKIAGQNRIETFYPPTGPLRRELYPRHLGFFEAGAVHRERLFLAANRVGKTEGVGAYETVLHMTGNYPHWWKGRRFDRAISAWAAGDTGKTTRDIIQLKLLGKPGKFGTGMIPAAALLGRTPKPGIPEAVETIYVQHVSGARSRIALKSYDQKREAFQGTEQDLIWLDEECPSDIYTECLMRTMTTAGLVMITFTPLRGMTELIREFLGIREPGEQATA
jgi:phage terminase large subunit-like protein